MLYARGGGKSTANKDKIVGFRSHRKTGCGQKRKMQTIPLVLTVLLMSKTEPETGGNRRKPLCVDLDGTLIHTDCLFETLVGAIRTSPPNTFRVPGWF